MQVVLLRVGIDTGSGGILGPLFADGSFEFVPIPDRFAGTGVDARTYSNTFGKKNRAFVNYFPQGRRADTSNQPLHFDPDFETFTYGDPTSPKASLRHLNEGDLLVFYAGLKGWDFDCPPALYIIGFFEVSLAGYAKSFDQKTLRESFKSNFHVMHKEVFKKQQNELVLVKGSPKSRLLKKAVKISSIGADKNGRPLHRLSLEMQSVFGSFNGKTSIQRCPPRWVESAFVPEAARFLRRLR